MTESPDREKVMRIVDANCNRTREAVRVIEEYFRFVNNNAAAAAETKRIRHQVKSLQQCFDQRRLLESRDTQSDPFNQGTTESEFDRSTILDVVEANFKRAQEACRVLEEYLKISENPMHAEIAKEIRFALYALEKKV